MRKNETHSYSTYFLYNGCGKFLYELLFVVPQIPSLILLLLRTHTDTHTHMLFKAPVNYQETVCADVSAKKHDCVPLIQRPRGRGEERRDVRGHDRESGDGKEGNEEQMEKRIGRHREEEEGSHQAVTELLCLSDGLLYSLLSDTQGDCERLCHTVS